MVVAVEAAEDVADADEADVDVTGMTVDLVRIVAPVKIVAPVRIVDLVRIVDPERIVEMLHPAVGVEMDLAVVAVEDPVVEEAVGARKNSAWTRRHSPLWDRLLLKVK